MASIGSIKISIGANVEALASDLSRAQSMLDARSKGMAETARQFGQTLAENLNKAASQGDMVRSVMDNIDRSVGKFASNIHQSFTGAQNVMRTLGLETTETGRAFLTAFDGADKMAGVLADLTGVAMPLVNIFSKVGPLTTALAGSVSTLAAAFTGVTVPVWGVVAAVSGIVVSFEYVRRNSDAFKSFFSNLWTELKWSASEGVNDLKKTINSMISNPLMKFDTRESKPYTALDLVDMPSFQTLPEFFGSIGDSFMDLLRTFSGAEAAGITPIKLPSYGSGSPRPPGAIADDKVANFTLKDTGDAPILDRQLGVAPLLSALNGIPPKVRAMRLELAGLKTDAQKMFDELREGFAQTFGAGLADMITNIFSGIDNERIRELNAQLRDQRKILADQASSNEQRDAAKDRIKFIEMEIKAEKQRGNVVLQTAKMAIESARQVISSLLAKAIAGIIAGEAQKGLFGLITAGVGIAAVSALFKSKVPKLAQGGLLYGPTYFQGGEYPGASSNPEVVAPLSELKKYMSGSTAEPTIIGGHIENMMRGEDLYQVIKLRAIRERRITGRDPFL